MEKLSFSIIRVYPKVGEVHQLVGARFEFMPMKGYDKWLSLRTKKDIIEYLDVYIRLDLTNDDVDNLRTLIEEKSTEMTAKLRELKLNYELTKMTADDKANYESELKEYLDSVDTEFTNYLTKNYTKLTF